jgi:hypothetical protein
LLNDIYLPTNQDTLPPGVNFTNILQAAFMHADPKRPKKMLNLTVFFALLGSAHVKAARKMLVKLTPAGGDN